MKVKFLSILAALALFVMCENPFVNDILPENGTSDKNNTTVYTVTFHRNHNASDVDPNPQTKTVRPPATTIDALPASPTPPQNYAFAGWNTSRDGQGTSFTASTPVTASINVYAQWTPGQGPQPPVSAVVNFEDYSLGVHSYFTSGYNTQGDIISPTVNIINDPVNAGQKSLQIASTDYGQAAVVPITLPAALNTAESFTFRFNLTNGTLSYKKILVYIANAADDFLTGGFGNPANSPYAQFAANLLGETDEIDEPEKNQWHNYSIAINGAGLNNAIRNLTGNVYLAIGIHHGDDEAITYLLDDLTFNFPGGPPPDPPSPVVTFENDNVGSTTKYSVTTAPQNGTGTVMIVNDPINNGEKSLSMNSTGYNIGAIVPINLPDALNTYNSFTFRFYLNNGTLTDKDMMVYVATDAGTFVEYGFGNASNEQHQFAANLLGKARLDDASGASSAWKSYVIAIESPGSAISNLSGNVYLAIGINHNANLTYYLDDLTFSENMPPPPPAFPTLVTFEDDAAGKTYGFTKGDNDPTVTVAANPTASAQKSLRVVTSSSSAWNQAAVIPINVADALSTYKSFTFKFNLQTNGTLMDDGANPPAPRKIQVYVANNTATFVQYGFGNPTNHSNQAQQFGANLLGEIEPDYGKTGQWVDYAINFTSPGSTISGLSGNMYVAIGINHGTSITYYLDDITFSKQEVVKEPGAALTGTLTTTNLTASGVEITAGSVTVSSGTQTIEYAVSITGTATSWQPGRTFTGLIANTNYTAHARAAANASYNAGPEKTATFTTLGKTAGAAVTGPITAITANTTHSRIVVNPVTVTPPNTGGQTVEYAISEETTEPVSGWQDSTTFSGLQSNTEYYVWARAKENDDYFAGASIVSATAYTTLAAAPVNPNVPPLVVNFEDKNINDTYNSTQGTNYATSVKVVANPANSGQKSLEIVTNQGSGTQGYNQAAIIPVNLPFELKDYESFTFKYYLQSGTGFTDQKISVYIASNPSTFVRYGFGNPANHPNQSQQFGANLLGEVQPDYSTGHWVEYEIEIDGDNLNGAIKNLSGPVYLAIGINHATTITLLFDDLTFYAKYSLNPEPTITPTTATFITSAPAVIPVTMNLYGKTLTGIKNGETPLTLGTDYTRSGDVITLLTSYFTGKTGTVTLTFEFSGGTSKNITITIRAEALLTSYNFAIDNPTIETYGTGITATIANGVLKVDKTAGYGDVRAVIIPFDLGNTNLSSYTKIIVTLKYTGDAQQKTCLAEYQLSGTAFGNPGTNNTFGSGSTGNPTSNTTTWTLNKSGSPSATGQIKIALSLGSTNPHVLEIQSIAFE